MTFNISLQPSNRDCREANPELWELYCFYRQQRIETHHTVTAILQMFGNPGDIRNRIVYLSRDEREMAQMMNIPVLEYAKHKLEVKKDDFARERFYKTEEGQNYLKYLKKLERDKKRKKAKKP